MIEFLVLQRHAGKNSCYLSKYLGETITIGKVLLKQLTWAILKFKYNYLQRPNKEIYLLLLDHWSIGPPDI